MELQTPQQVEELFQKGGLVEVRYGYREPDYIFYAWRNPSVEDLSLLVGESTELTVEPRLVEKFREPERFTEGDVLWEKRQVETLDGLFVVIQRPNPQRRDSYPDVLLVDLHDTEVKRTRLDDETLYRGKELCPPAHIEVYLEGQRWSAVFSNSESRVGRRLEIHPPGSKVPRYERSIRGMPIIFPQYPSYTNVTNYPDIPEGMFS